MFNFYRWMILLILPSLAFADDWQSIHRASQAIHSHSFSGSLMRQTHQGTFIYALSRIRDKKQILDSAVALDGGARAVLRHNDRLDYYAASENDLWRLQAEQNLFFPDMLPDDIETLKSFYFLHTKDDDRIAGEKCRWIWLIPYDVWRYMQGFCLSKHSHLPLAHLIKRSDGKIVQNDAFVDINFHRPSKKTISLPAHLPLRASQSIKPQTQVNQPKGHIRIPTGFILQAYHAQKNQYILTDGLVHVSLFLEKSDTPLKETARTLRGALSIAQTTRNQTKITALGDMPPDGLLRLVRHVEFQ